MLQYNKQANKRVYNYRGLLYQMKKQNPPTHNLQEEQNSQNNHNQQFTTETTPIKDLNFENYEIFVTDLKTKYPTSVKIEQLEQLKFQRFMGKKLILTSNYSLSFWTDEYKLELENYLKDSKFSLLLVLCKKNINCTQKTQIIPT